MGGRRNASPTGYGGIPWSLRYGFCQSKPPPPGRGAPWCSRGNDPICTYIPTTLPSDGANSQPSPSRGRGTVATVDEDASLICTTPWFLRRGIVVRGVRAPWTVADACPYRVCAIIVIIPFGDRLTKIVTRTTGLPPYPVGERLGAPVNEHHALASTRGTDHGICTNNVRMQTKRLLLGMEKLSALLTDEVVHKHTSRLPRYCDSQQKRHLSFVQAYKIKKTFKKCVTLSKKRRLYR